MHQVIEQLLGDGPVLTDGAWGTELQTRGLSSGECPDGWNLTHPQQVEQVARAYVDVGSRITLTNTFRANRLSLANCELAERIEEINRIGVEISRRAVGDRACVFGSIGPSGKMLLSGDVSEDELLSAFGEQARLLARAGVDGLVIETMSDLAEAKSALEAAKSTGLPVVVCMVFDSGEAQDRTMMGSTPEQVAGELAAGGADVVGANCGQGIEGYAAICRRLSAATDLPIWIKPNAGTPEMVDGQIVYRTTPEDFGRHASAVLDAGASFLGGCCGAGPEFIKALKAGISP